VARYCPEIPFIQGPASEDRIFAKHAKRQEAVAQVAKDVDPDAGGGFAEQSNPTA